MDGGRVRLWSAVLIGVDDHVDGQNVVPTAYYSRVYSEENEPSFWDCMTGVIQGHPLQGLVCDTASP